MAAREAILLASSMESAAVNNKEIKKVKTVCMASGTQPKDWAFHGNDYEIIHMPGDSEGNAYEPCLSLVKDIIKEESVHTPSGRYLSSLTGGLKNNFVIQ